MDNKSTPQDLPPPPYTPSSGSTVLHDQTHLASITSDLQHHFASLSDRIRSTQQVQAARKSLSDSFLLSCIVPLIEDFIADLGSQHALPLVATLTLVPSTAVSENAVLSGMEEMKRRGEVCLVSRVKVNQNDKNLPKSVSSPAGSDGEQRWITGQEFSDWGRFGSSGVSMEGLESGREMLWWRDEELARRLASNLQPKIEVPEPLKATPLVTATDEQKHSSQVDKRSWGWPGRRKNRSLDASKNESNISDQGSKDSLGEAEHYQGNELRLPQMSVEAQEVAFRQENEFGIIESHNGWALVVVVAIRE